LVIEFDHYDHVWRGFEKSRVQRAIHRGTGVDEALAGDLDGFELFE